MWENQQGKFAYRCPYCGSKYIHNIDYLTFDEWKQINATSFEYLKMKYPDAPVINDDCPVLKEKLRNGYFDSMPWAEAYKQILFYKEEMVDDENIG